MRELIAVFMVSSLGKWVNNEALQNAALYQTLRIIFNFLGK
jgi:hypothetical protein